MATDMSDLNNIFQNKEVNKMQQLEAKVESMLNALKQLAFQQQKASSVLDNVSECLSAIMYTLEKGDFTFDNFTKALPEVQAGRMDAVLKQMLENKLAVQLSEVEANSAVLVSGWVGDLKKTLRRSFNVSETENQAFLGKKIGDKVKLSPEEVEEFEILTVYRIGSVQ